MARIEITPVIVVTIESKEILLLLDEQQEAEKNGKPGPFEVLNEISSRCVDTEHTYIIPSRHFDRLPAVLAPFAQQGRESGAKYLWIR